MHLTQVELMLLFMNRMDKILILPSLRALAKQSHTVMDRRDCFVAPLLAMTE